MPTQLLHDRSAVHVEQIPLSGVGMKCRVRFLVPLSSFTYEDLQDRSYVYRLLTAHIRGWGRQHQRWRVKERNLAREVPVLYYREDIKHRRSPRTLYSICLTQMSVAQTHNSLEEF